MTVQSIPTIVFTPKFFHDSNRSFVSRIGYRNDGFEPDPFEYVPNNRPRRLIDVTVAPVLARDPIPEIDVVVDRGISTDPNEFIGASQPQRISRETQCSLVLDAILDVSTGLRRIDRQSVTDVLHHLGVGDERCIVWDIAGGERPNDQTTGFKPHDPHSRPEAVPERDARWRGLFRARRAASRAAEILDVGTHARAFYRTRSGIEFPGWNGFLTGFAGSVGVSLFDFLFRPRLRAFAGLGFGHLYFAFPHRPTGTLTVFFATVGI